MTPPRQSTPAGKPPRAVQIPDWASIDTVLLDLDGTLLDLAFDTFFWWHHIPAMYGASRSLQPDEAREQLRPRFKACEGTLNWYCVDYWSRELGLDVPALKRAAGERIDWLPGAEEFLQRLRAKGKRVVLMTNAHPEAVRIRTIARVLRGISTPCTAPTRSGRPRKTRRSGQRCERRSRSIRTARSSSTTARRWCELRVRPVLLGLRAAPAR